jgi:hypothetical protein
MSQISVWRVKFHLELTAGRITSGPHVTFIGLAGGSRGDGQNQTTGAAILSALNADSNLLNILKGMGATGLTAIPGGTVVIDAFEPASAPDCWQ